MVPPKRSTKMDLNSFLNDDTFGSAWEETDVDLNKITIPIESVKANTIPLEELAAAAKGGANQGFRGIGGGGSGGGSRLDPALGGGRTFERTEYPVPDRPPYRAIINNIPWDISPEGVQAWVEDGLHKPDAVEEVDLPRSIKDPTRLKGIAFVTLKEREDLEQALTFNATKLNDRTVYVSVAAPRRDGFDWGGARGSAYQASGDSGVDLDWGSARGSQFRGPKPMRDDPDLDWGVARGSQFRGARPVRDEPDLDWGAVRGSQFKGETRPPREESNLDWGSARGSQFQSGRSEGNRRGRGFFHDDESKKEESDLDWGNVRSRQPREPREPRAPREQREVRESGPDLDWGSARGSQFGRKTGGASYKKQTHEKEQVEDKPKIQRSAFEVLSNEDDEDEDEDTEKKDTNEEDVAELENKTQSLSVDDKDNGSWNVVGKK
ncbi:TIF3 (YPR163C) [Zygosaccharomyces parabailii]|uniref:BN860_01288g1_1 n=1 Tax=Zygosaccharomyces bailii (strain CLIB 213 / ATCC 58445 / CBS 680 / BCRC 21525 / NBRC 1098 / NCYC 1416 / NRRL Y-2227) TaxID=1333698 RepID=A0A8J2SV07_ZYGB2|nr:TIF3 (YPR163C) [Zygosaccharomyces parabailii]CDF87211.1 BN860_01288g1_1 [Zygosaccharomyces bailii CLIB 213]CDH15723.1 related to Eukaryotic translation initiation factor 4B [Zygosaccharomyces bailii ISA1307]